MITPRDNYLIVARGGRGLWVPDMWEDNFTMSFNKYHHRFDEDGIEWDPFGVSYQNSFPTAHKFWDEVTDWRKHMPMPDLDQVDWDAEAKIAQAESRDKGKALTCHIGDGGYMLVLANTMGFTDALVALLEEEDELLEFFAQLTEYNKKCIDYAVKYLKPDIISYPDDSSNGRGPFMSQSTYQTLFTPFMKEACDYAHSYGCIFNVHNCGDPQFILDEYLQMGVDVVNANIDSPSLREFRQKYSRELVMEGGWKNTGEIARMDVAEDVLKEAVDEYYGKFADEQGFISHINCIVAMGDQNAMVRKATWGQERSNELRFERYYKMAQTQMEFLNQYTNGMDSMWEVMGIDRSKDNA